MSEIQKEEQFNDAVGQYKVLSSNAGVGALVASTSGFFFMPRSTSEWGVVQHTVANLGSTNGIAAEEIKDGRFIQFLKSTQGLTKLEKMVAVPHIDLSPSNAITTSAINEHPLSKQYAHDVHANLQKDFFQIPSIVFPRWMYSSSTSKLKPIKEWRDLWISQNCNGGLLEYFAPPKDPENTYKKEFNVRLDFYRNLRNAKDKKKHKPLHQMPMVLICPKGHISDIPWDRYFAAKLENDPELEDRDHGIDLFRKNYASLKCIDGKQHELQFIEARNNANSWGTLKCSKCGRRVFLEGISNIRVHCRGESPWIAGRAYSPCMDGNVPTLMRHALVTSNSVYYANMASSLFIPEALKPSVQLNSAQQELIAKLEKKYNRAIQGKPDLSKTDFVNGLDLADIIDTLDLSLTDQEISIVTDVFSGANVAPVEDENEAYRFDEFSVFESKTNSTEKELKFEDIQLPVALAPYFKKIQKVYNLAVTSTQLGFSRVSLPQPKRVGNKIEYEHGMRIFSEEDNAVQVLPANQVWGEGIFFQIDEEALEKWIGEHQDILNSRYSSLPPDRLEQCLADKMDRYHNGRFRFYVLHTLSHILIKELEFSCGYPSASLHERLYYSDRMCGFLIYTADGSAGSMGGLVSQGDPALISGIIKRALNRAYSCSSDPLCWENKAGLSLASCFSCTMISETSCEERNYALDRQILVNDDFGFLKDLR